MFISPPLGGCTYSMTTYSYSNNEWSIAVPAFLIPTACEDLTEEELQSYVFKDDSSIFYYDRDIESEKLIK